MMSKIKRHSRKEGKWWYNYLKFDSVTAFNQFVDDEKLNHSNEKAWKYQVLEASLSLKKGTEWYGTPTPESVNELGKHNHFSGMELLEELLPKIKNHFKEYLQFLEGNVMSKPKVAYNDRGVGMFSFDRASMGLLKKHKVDTKTPLDRINSQLRIELEQKKITTQVKKVYAYFEHKKTVLPSMRLYLMAGANANINGDQMLYVGLACSELVTFMEERGVPVEVNVILGTAIHHTTRNLGIVTIKHFQDSLDKNQLLLMSSDPRYFRFRGFKSLIALTNAFGINIPSGLGRLEPNMGKDFVNLLNKEDHNGFVFEQSYSLDEAAKETTRIITTYNQQIKNEQST